MQEKKLKWWAVALIIICSIAIAWWITVYLGENTSSFEIFTPSNKRGDFHITDFYNAAVRNSIDNEETSFSDNVLIVAIDQLNRQQSLEVINTVAQLHPSVIGLDFPFEDSIAYHDEILNTIVTNPLIIHATKVTEADNGCLRREYLSFYEKEYPAVQVGFVNIDAVFTWNVVRTFHPYVIDENGDTIPSMALAMAKVVNPKRARNLLSRNHDKEIINFVYQKIEVIPANQLNNEDIATKFIGKSVLIGDTAYASDIRVTPLREPMSGLFIHAYALQTILTGRYIKEWPKWIIWIIAFVASILFVILLQYAKSLNYIGNWLVRISLLGLIILLVYLGYRIFAIFQCYADFTIVISMLAFSSLVFDITYAIIGVIKWVSPKITCATKKVKFKHKKQ